MFIFIFFSISGILLQYQLAKCQPLEMVQQQTIFNLQKYQSFILTKTSFPQSTTFKTLILMENMKIINSVNANPAVGYKFQANQFITLTEKQVKHMYLTLIPSETVSINFAKTITQPRAIPSQRFLATPSSTIASQQFTPRQAIYINKSSTTPQLESSVLDIVKEYFQKKKQISVSEVQKQIIPHYKFKGNLNSIEPVSNAYLPQKRLLQQKKNLNNQSKTLNKTAINQTKNIDWTCVSGKVRAQGNCGACYIFSAIDNFSAALAIYYLTFFIEFSVQQIIDCSSNSLTFGCEGGFIEGTFAYMMNPGIYTAFLYPYISVAYEAISPKNGKININPCKQLNKKITRWKIGNFINILNGNCNMVKNQLQNQPITVGITGYRLLFYKSGVFSGCNSTDEIDHAVLLVGYKAGVGWKIKNSWGTKWGEDGYAWISQQNDCRLCQNAFYATLPLQYGKIGYQERKILKKCPKP